MILSDHPRVRTATWRAIPLRGFVPAALAMLAISQATAQLPEKSKPVVHVHQSGKIRVFYEMEGRDAVDTADVNQNGVPDQVEDVLTQTRGAGMLLIETLGFPDPFESERFREAAFLDIRF